MTPEILAVFLILAAAVILFMTERLPVDVTALVVVAALILAGAVTPEEGVAGFGHPATITVGSMFVLSAGLFRTGAVNFVGTWLTRVGRKNFWLALLALMLTAGGISAFINDTAVVAILMPVVLSLAKDLKVSPSKLLMPLSFGALFGGVCTLIGTSTNILVGSLAAKHGEPPFGMFEFTPFGLVILGAGTLYMVLIGVRLIPERRDEMIRTGGRVYQTEIVIQPGAGFIGKPLLESSLVQDLDIKSLEIFRDSQRLRLPTLEVVLKAGDLLRVLCDVETIGRFQRMKGIVLRSELNMPESGEERGETILVEALLGPTSRLEGKNLKQARLRSKYGATVHAIMHRGVTIRDNLEDAVLHSGDILLMEVKADELEDLSESDAFMIISEGAVQTFRKRKMAWAFAIIFFTVAAAATGAMPILQSAVIGAVLMVISGCLTPSEAYTAIQWKVIFLLAGVLALGTALETSGAALLIADILVNTVGTLGPLPLMSAFYLLTSILTELMSNNATAALLTPIVISAADSLGVDSRPFLMAVTYAASAAFMTPVGYQTNTLIYGPGRYKYADFLRVGTPLNILFWILATLLIPVFWPF